MSAPLHHSLSHVAPLLPSPSSQLSRGGRAGAPSTAHMHTTDPGGGPGMQSVLEAGDLEELMAMVSQKG